MSCGCHAADAVQAARDFWDLNSPVIRGGKGLRSCWKELGLGQDKGQRPGQDALRIHD
jgi:hypothetical protein